MKNKFQQGFTLIELMIVIAIIGILAAVALPAYQDYSIRAQVTEAMTLAAEAKVAMTSFRKERGHFPVTNASAGLAAPGSIIGNYSDNLNIVGGVITITMGNKANDAIANATVVLSPATIAGSLTSSSPLAWVCGNAEAPTGTVEIAGAGSAASGTSLPDKYLPVACRQ